MKVLMVAYDNQSYITWFPQGLAYLAASIREAHGGGHHTVEIYEQDIYHWADEHLTGWLDEHDYDVVIVSVIGGYYQYRKLLALSKAVNASKKRKDIKYLIGGHGPASDPEFFLKKTKADVVGIGEGERTIVELLDVLEYREGEAYWEKLKDVAGIAYLDDNGKYIRTMKRELISNIDEISFPAYDLFDMTYYALLRLPNCKVTDRCLPVLSGRGCTFACNFCYRLDKGFRPRSAENIIAEIKMLKEKYNITYIGFSDELLMSSRERTVELCQAFIDAKLEIRWDCNGRLNYADIPTLKKMKEAGCVFINYGIESLDNDTLRVMHKALTKEMITRGIENTLEVGISPGLNIIFGNINEPLSALDEAVEFLLKYDDHAQMRTIRPVTPYPGCELFDYALEHGMVKDTEDFYENLHTNSDLLSVNFTKYTDEQVYKALYEANLKLIEKYVDNNKSVFQKTCWDLYMNQNADFRGFRNT